MAWSAPDHDNGVAVAGRLMTDVERPDYRVQAVRWTAPTPEDEW
jgi:hypothetical protein